MLTTTEVEQFIRLTLKQWGINVPVSFCPKVWNKRKAYGLYWPDEKKIELSPLILKSFPLFKHVFYHELCHALDHRERGSLMRGERVNAHGANFNKWCRTLGIKKGRIIPKELNP